MTFLLRVLFIQAHRLGLLPFCLWRRMTQKGSMWIIGHLTKWQSRTSIIYPVLMCDFFCTFGYVWLHRPRLLHDRLPRHQQLCNDSSQSFRAIIVVHDTPTTTVGDNRGEREETTPKWDGGTTLGGRLSIRGIVDRETGKTVEAQDFKFSHSRLLLSCHNWGGMLEV